MGVGMMQTKNEMFLEQSAYTKALLCRFGMDKANSVATPVDVNADLVTTSDEVEDCDKDLYQSAVEPNLSDPPVGRIATNVLTSYLDRVWALSEEDDPHFPLIKLCKAHFMKNIAVNAKAKYPKLKPKQRRLIMTYFAAMIEAQGKNELYATFRDFVQLIQSPWIEEDIETLIEHYKNSETPALDLNFVEPTHALIVEDVGRYRDKCAVGKKFEAVAEEVMKEKYLQGTK
ncbi:hypothetical protein FHG87_022255 [Trinorchestia longiramus]|nr:hypothetical protein FHG87_022255 [Trinorchestia longiramus]